MEIFYQENHHVFSIQMANSTYAFGTNANNRLVNLYWGPKLEDLGELEPLEEILDVKESGDGCFRNLHNSRYEYHGGEFYSYEEKALDVTFPDGVRGAQLVYEGHEIGAQELKVFLRDEHYPLKVTLLYCTYPGLDLLTRQAIIDNPGQEPLQLHKMQSATLHLPDALEYRLTHYAGNWGAEYQRREQMLNISKTVIQNNHGNTSGPHAAPFVMLDPWGKAEELTGQVYVAALHWSGNFKITCEQNFLGSTAISLGINEEEAGMVLKPGKHFKTPEVTVGFSAEGFGGIRKQLYDYQLDHLLPRRSAFTPFPVLYNSYYPYEMNIDEEKVAGSMEYAAAIGVELFVVDDGWMPGRDCEKTGLGDWVACPDRFPNGLKPLSRRAHELGMKFGLWVEPEMVNPDSDLYRTHPDWVLQSPNRPQTLSRSQLALNLAREDVMEYLIQMLDGLVEEYELDYLKWDMNRYISDFGWAQGTKEQRDRLPITLIENVYRIWDHLNEKYPNLLLENCAHGGARTDYGMLRYADRNNRSDNNRPVDVILLHEGFTDMLVPKLAGGAGNINGDMRIPYVFRENLGFAGSMSIGANLLTCSQEYRDMLKKSIAQFKLERGDLQNSYMYHLLSAWKGAYTVWQYVRRDQKAFTLFGFCYGRHYPDTRLHRVQMAGLQPDWVYECVIDEGNPQEVGKRYTGRTLMQIGLQLPIEENYAAMRRVFRVVEE